MRNILFILLLCNVMLLKAQSLELEHWRIINSSEIADADAKVSQPSYPTTGWYQATVPTTVLNALVKENVYPDPRIGLNNYLIPDVSDEFNARMDLAKYNYLKSGRNPWQDPYWYRTEITLPKSYKGKKVWLTLYGINYRADVWVNGRLVADKNDIVGMFRRFKLDITDYALPGANNCVAVKIYQVDHPGVPTPGTQLKVFGPVRGHSYDIFKDETLKISGGWDCAPVVRDRNMGIYQKVTIEATDEVVIENPFIVTTLPKQDTSLADVNIKLEVKNTSGKAIEGKVNALITLVNDVKFPTYTKHMEGYLKPIKITKKVSLGAGEKKVVELTSEDFPSLLIKNPYLWYPNGYGEQYLHHIKLLYNAGGKVSDTKEFDFGIREVEVGLNRVEVDGDKAEVEYGRVYYVNGKRVFCKGGWIQPDILLEESDKRIYDEARLMAEANINLIGSEDMPSPSETWFESFDKYGLMWWHVFYQCYRMTPGTETENNPLDHNLAIACVEDMMLRYRNHPSIISWVGVNEVLMNENLYRLTKEKVKSLDTTRIYIPTTSYHWDVDALTPYLKEDLPTGTTDDGAPDYNWAPSSYFFDKVREVYLQMFRNELGMPSVPMYNSLRKFIPTAESTANVNSPIFPLDSIWAEHGAWDVSNYCYRSYDNAIRTMFGDPKTAKEYADNAQFLSADGYRAMFEAANHRMWDITSGVMIWKINSCWPDVCWQIYDWYLQLRRIGQFSGEVNNRFAHFTFLGSNHDYTIGSTGTVNGSCGSVFQNGDIIDVGRIQTGNSGLTYVIDVFQYFHIGNVRSFQWNTVQHPQRVLRTIQGGCTANTDFGRSTRSTGNVAYGKSGNLSGQCLVYTLGCTHHLIRDIDLRYGGRQLTAFHSLISRHNYRIEHVGGRLESNIIFILARYELYFQHIIADVTTIKTGNSLRNGDGELTVNISNDTNGGLIIPNFLQIIGCHIDRSADERQIILRRDDYTLYLPVCGKGVRERSY